MLSFSVLFFWSHIKKIGLCCSESWWYVGSDPHKAHNVFCFTVKVGGMWIVTHIKAHNVFCFTVKVGGMRVVTHTKAHKEKPEEEEKGAEGEEEFEE